GEAVGAAGCRRASNRAIHLRYHDVHLGGGRPPRKFPAGPPREPRRSHERPPARVAPNHRIRPSADWLVLSAFSPSVWVRRQRVPADLTMKDTTHRRTWKTLMALATIYLVWGSTFLAIRVGRREVPP